jgi:hypothetical protein
MRNDSEKSATAGLKCDYREIALQLPQNSALASGMETGHESSPERHNANRAKDHSQHALESPPPGMAMKEREVRVVDEHVEVIAQKTGQAEQTRKFPHWRSPRG